MPSLPPFLHARITVELPFRLLLPSGLYLLEILPPGAALIFVLDSEPAWILGYSANVATPKVLRNPKAIARAADTEGVRDPEINAWADNAGFDRAVAFPAKSILELRVGFTAEQFPSDVRNWANERDTRLISVFAINQFLLRYQLALGFSPASGFVAAVSEIELNFFAVQLFEDDTPKSPLVPLTASSPGKEPPLPFPPPPDCRETFEQALRAKVVPLWLELAHEAHSLLYRRRAEASILAWFQSLEVGVGQAESASGISIEGTVEKRLQHLVSKLLSEPLAEPLIDGLSVARKLRNRIVHEGERLRFNDTAADGVAVSAIEALRILERCLRVALQGPRASDS